jgi:putative transcriptional regulator
MKETIANIVQELRSHTPMTQEDLANSVGVSRQTIIAIEKGNYVPSVLLAFKIAHTFNQPVDKIFTISYE